MRRRTRLRGADGFKTAATAYRKPGLFFYVNALELLAKTDAAGRARGEPFDADVLSWVKIIANQKALRVVAGGAQFRDGGVSFTANVTFDPALQKPARGLFRQPVPWRALKPLHHAPRPAQFAATVNLPEKNRAAAAPRAARRGS